jgi:hypothetical protein
MTSLLKPTLILTWSAACPLGSNWAMVLMPLEQSIIRQRFGQFLIIYSNNQPNF